MTELGPAHLLHEVHHRGCCSLRMHPHVVTQLLLHSTMQAGFQLDICSNTIDVVFQSLQRATSESTVTKESQTISKEIRGELRGTSGSDCTSRRCLSHENTRLGFTRLINRKASGRISFGQMRKHRSVLEISSNQLRVHRCKKLNMYSLYIL